MKKVFLSSLFIGLIVLGISSCSKKDDYSSEPLEDYMQLAVGKFVRYRLDSMKFINFGQQDTIIKYQAKDVIDAAITDNLGRPSWRVVRYLSDTTGQAPWTPTATYMITPLRETIEVIENNLRFMKLKLPIKEGYNWKGNSYISAFSVDPNWELRYYDDWDYMYENVGADFNGGIGNVENTITVNQRDEMIGIPNDPQAYSEYNYSQEVYGKGIGLVFRNFIHWEYQPPAGGNQGFKTGYGIKLVMIDHN